MKIVNDIVDFLYPRICVASEVNLDKENSNSFVLDSVLYNLKETSEDDLAELRGKVNSDFAYAVYDFVYKSDFEKIIHHVKYSGLKNLGEFLGRHISEKIQLEIIKQKVNYDFIIPVPLHKTKIRERGYNQSEHLAKGLSEAINIPVLLNSITRKSYTKTQTKLNKKEREKNVENAFVLNESGSEKLKDKNVILLDDVITTGATVNECIKRLKEAGVITIFTAALSMAELRDKN